MKRKSSLYLTSTQKKKRFRRRLKLFFAFLVVALIVVAFLYYDEIKGAVEDFFSPSDVTVESGRNETTIQPMSSAEPDNSSNTVPTADPAEETPKVDVKTDDEAGKDAKPTSTSSPTPSSTKPPKKKPTKPKFSFRYSFGKVVDGSISTDIDENDEFWVVQYILGEKKHFNRYQKDAKKMAKKIKAFMDSYISSSMSNYDKARAIHDYLVRNVHYRYVRWREKRSTRKYDAYGALVNHEAVCAGYAKAFELMCACCGIKCHYVEGEATNDHGTDDHAWNMIKTGKKWRHVDVTWDDPVPERYQDGIEHTYFSVTDRFMRRDHSWFKQDYPKCR